MQPAGPAAPAIWALGNARAVGNDGQQPSTQHLEIRTPRSDLPVEPATNRPAHRQTKPPPVFVDRSQVGLACPRQHLRRIITLILPQTDPRLLRPHRDFLPTRGPDIGRARLCNLGAQKLCP